jgi:hypothetical protein
VSGFGLGADESGSSRSIALRADAHTSESMYGAPGIVGWLIRSIRKTVRPARSRLHSPYMKTAANIVILILVIAAVSGVLLEFGKKS